MSLILHPRENGDAFLQKEYFCEYILAKTRCAIVDAKIAGYAVCLMRGNCASDGKSDL